MRPLLSIRFVGQDYVNVEDPHYQFNVLQKTIPQQSISVLI